MHCSAFRVIASLAVALMLGSATSLAQDRSKSQGESFIIEALPDRFARRVESRRNMLLQFALADPDKTPRGVINALKIWTADYPTIRVCFFSGSQKVRARIVNTALEWTKAVPGLPLDFGDVANPRLCRANEVNHIRIGFADEGYWSLLGTDSILLADQKEQSMNLQGFDKAPPPDGQFRATVLHEFGHAIGLEHEHQNPLSKCRDEFNWPKIEKSLAGPPNNWSKDIVQSNLGELNRPGLLATSFDRESIMLYTFPASYFKAGKKSSCFSPSNTKLSNGDKAMTADLYPVDADQRMRVANRIREHHLATIKASGKAEGARSAVLQLIEEYQPERPEKRK